MKNLYSFIFLFMAFTGYLYCQPSWYNATPSLLSHLPTRSTNCGAMMDINGDGVDDLLILNRGIWATWVQSSGKNLSLTAVDTIQTASQIEWSLVAGDFKNNGAVEFLIAGNRNGLKRVQTQNEILTLTRTPLNIYAQASNTVDINNDGHLDYYVCDDLGPNVIMINNGQGQLIQQEIIDFLENDPTDGSGNYGSEWVDINGDMLPDLCIAKCSAFANEPTDPRRINRVYINNGDGTFTNKAEELGLASGAQSWVNTFGDIDNDGDQDVLIVNHFSPHQLMENNNGRFFTEIQLQAPISSFGFQAVMRDFDNDGFLDIFITSVEGDLLLHNNGDKTFTEFPLNFGPSEATSFVVGDINDDGFLDIFAMFGEPINTVGQLNDQLWLGIPNENNYFKVNLEGRLSNRMGIGAQVELYGPWGQQTRYVKGGESYGVFNSLQQHFGLHKHNTIDSLVIKWPSGTKDIYTDNLKINSTFLAQEGQCLSLHAELYAHEIISGNQSIELAAYEGFDSYLWNTGDTSQKINVLEGEYFVVMTDSMGCKTVSKPIKVISGCFTDQKLILADREVSFCGQVLSPLMTSKAKSYLWSDGSTADRLLPTQTGWYSLTAQDYCEATRTDSVFVTIFDFQYELKGDTIDKGQRALLTSDKNTTYWLDYNTNELLHIGQNFQTPELDETTVYTAQVFDIKESKLGRVGEQLFPLTNLYGNNTTSGDMIFEVLRPCTIKSVRVNTDTDGQRQIIILNDQKEQIFSKVYDIKNGISTLELNLFIKERGRYTILTDIEFNQTSLGFRSPRLVRTFNNTAYPYVLGEDIRIIGSSFGPVYYYYFYNWEVEHDIILCESDQEPVVAVVNKGSSLENNQNHTPILIFPNPVIDFLEIETHTIIQSLKLFDAMGNVVKRERETISQQLDMQNLTSGIYFLHLETEQGLTVVKIIKI